MILDIYRRKGNMDLQGVSGEVKGMDPIEKDIEDWREFVLEELLNALKRELNENIDVLIDGMKDRGLLSA
jgi:hypothetical protein